MKSIDKARSLLALGVRELSRETNITPAQWSRWLSGKQSPNLASLEIVAEKKGIETVDLVRAYLERREQDPLIVIESRKGNDRPSTVEGDRRGKGQD